MSHKGAIANNRHIHHCFAANTPVDLNNDNPKRPIVGAIVSGPMYLSRKPTIPVIPRATSNNAAHMIAPCT